MRVTVPSPAFATHTAPSPTAIPLASFPTGTGADASSRLSGSRTATAGFAEDSGGMLRPTSVPQTAPSPAAR